VLAAGGGFAAGRDTGLDCPKGDKQAVTEIRAAGPDATLPKGAGPWDHEMIATCFRTVTLPHVRLVGGPFGDDELLKFIDTDLTVVWDVMKLDDSGQIMAPTRAEDSKSTITFENGNAQVAIRPWTWATSTFGPASHYRVADGTFLSTDAA
jgi:hypothetical protein